MANKKVEDIGQDIYLALARALYPKETFPTVYPQLKMQFPWSLIIKYADEGQHFIARQSLCLRSSVTAPVAANQYWFWKWDYFYTPIEVKWTDSSITGYKILTQISQKQADQQNADWETETASSSPTNYIYQREQRAVGTGQSFKLYGKPYLAGTVWMACHRLPDALYVKGAGNEVNRQTDCSLEHPWDQVITDYVLYRLQGKSVEGLVAKSELMHKESQERDHDGLITMEFDY